MLKKSGTQKVNNKKVGVYTPTKITDYFFEVCFL